MHFQHQVVIRLIIPRNADFWAKKTWEIIAVSLMPAQA